jgi:hypothetical protein
MINMKNISYYYENLGKNGIVGDDIGGLIDLHRISFEKYGWQVVLVNEKTARRHPKYKLFTKQDSILGTSKNPWVYTRACYMRWLAYAVEGIPFCDFDVVNYGFTPAMAEEIRQNTGAVDDPVFISFAGAAGLVSSAGYEKVIDTFVDFIEHPVIEGLLVEYEINDMTILRQFQPQWFTRVSYEDPNFVKDYSQRLWEDARLVHFPYHYTSLPRVSTAKSARQI